MDNDFSLTMKDLVKKLRLACLKLSCAIIPSSCVQAWRFAQALHFFPNLLGEALIHKSPIPFNRSICILNYKVAMPWRFDSQQDFSCCFLRADHVELPTCCAKNPHGHWLVYVTNFIITSASLYPAEKLVYVIVVMSWKPQFYFKSFWFYQFWTLHSVSLSNKLFLVKLFLNNWNCYIVVIYKLWFWFLIKK
jgi:hypothetical protein